MVEDVAEDRNEAGWGDTGRLEESPYRVFAYALAERADLYLDVVGALVAAKDRFRLQLRPADVVRELAASGRHREEDEVLSALEALAEWGNLSRFYDSAAPETLTEFYGKRFLYQLTPEGVAAHGGVEAARQAGLASGGRLSAVLLPGIVERLEAVRAEIDHPDPARLYALLIDLFSTFTELADNAGRYMSDLAVETTEVAADHDRFVAYKRKALTSFSSAGAQRTPRKRRRSWPPAVARPEAPGPPKSSCPRAGGASPHTCIARRRAGEIPVVRTATPPCGRPRAPSRR